ncbi:MAG: aminopeptidase P family N-terminal domain-containing protein, partial [Eggerthellaceae bacterium]|nr:aminopeptidase P family N-terminal domain-containing protein [Eggerthellaceae bacterium]
MRIGALREVCAREGIDLACVRDTSSIRWLTAFDGVFDEERAHCLMVTPSRAVLHTDSRYVTACEQAARGGCVEV